MATAVSVALDWSPNTNHSGFYIAHQKGWYAEAGLDVTIISPHEDDYKTTPLSRVANGTATFAITPSVSTEGSSASVKAACNKGEGCC